jgi:hypothetical protein
MDTFKTLVNIVLVGRFNPNSFMPNALVNENIIEQREAELASFIMLLPDECVHFTLPWLEIRVIKNQLVITSLEEPNIRILDFVMRALADADPKAVVLQLGINYTAHYDMGTIELRNQLGKKIAPAAAWGTWGDEINKSMEGKLTGTYLQGGVISMTMKLPFHRDAVNGFRSISIQPSELRAAAVMFSSNHHHQTALPLNVEASREKISDEESTKLLLTDLSKHFEDSIEAAGIIFQEVLNS